MIPVPLHPDAALLLDCDGTLLDIAPTPDAVVVPPGLTEALRRVRLGLGHAVAIVTGRPIDQIDALFGDAPHAVAGEHGAAIRHGPGRPVERAELPSAPSSWVARARQHAAAFPGALVEPKAHGFVFHYRLAPEAGQALHAAALDLVAEAQGAYLVMPAHMAWEVKPRGADKGIAVQRLMAREPFAGRKPIYIGDDVTDEDGMRAAQQLGGVGLRVQETFETAAGVRAWLQDIAARQTPR